MKYKTTIRTFPIGEKFGYKIKCESESTEIYILSKGKYKSEKTATKYARKFYTTNLK